MPESKEFFEGVKWAEANPRAELEDALDNCPYAQNTREGDDFLRGVYRRRGLTEIEELFAPPEQLTLEETYEIYNERDDDED